jgi:small subunit ribosomal protein S17e
MGRIKSATVKKIAKKMVVGTPQLFSKDFEKNKKVLDGMVTNKKTRNAIAGYITKLSKK